MSVCVIIKGALLLNRKATKVGSTLRPRGALNKYILIMQSELQDYPINQWWGPISIATKRRLVLTGSYNVLVTKMYNVFNIPFKSQYLWSLNYGCFNELQPLQAKMCELLHTHIWWSSVMLPLGGAIARSLPLYRRWPGVIRKTAPAPVPLSLANTAADNVCALIWRFQSEMEYN